jgi:hypothetical protein
LGIGEKTVHHQIIWDQIGIVLTEDWPHLIVDDYAAALR